MSTGVLVGVMRGRRRRRDSAMRVLRRSPDYTVLINGDCGVCLSHPASHNATLPQQQFPTHGWWETPKMRGLSRLRLLPS